MSTQSAFSVVPDDVMILLQGMPSEQRQEVFDFVKFLDRKQRGLDSIDGLELPRVLGLHAGQGWVSDDFEQPLPDDLWLENL